MEKRKMRVIKKYLVLATIVLALVFSVSTQQTFADQDVRYVYPTIETSCDQINATAYRFHNGDSLNFIFIFTTEEGVLASIPENYTDYSKTEKRGHLYITCYLDDKLTRSAHRSLGVEGSAWVENEQSITVRNAGDHTIKYYWLFTIDEDAEGYLDINFRTEVKLKLEKLPAEPFPTQILLIVGIGSAACGATIVGVIFIANNRHHKRSKEEQ